MWYVLGSLDGPGWGSTDLRRQISDNWWQEVHNRKAANERMELAD